MKGQIVRPLHYAAGSAILVILALLLALVWSNRQSASRLQEVARSVAHGQALQAVGLHMTQLLADDLTGTSNISRSEVAQAAAEIQALLQPEMNLYAETPALFSAALNEFLNVGRSTRVATARALGHFRQATFMETGVQSRQLNELLADSHAEGQLIFFVMVALPLLMLLLFWLSYRRIFSPIENLRQLLSRVADGDIRPIDLRGIDRLLKPLFQNYNRMAARLIELELSHRQRASDLEIEVQAATAAVLEQQRALARAERMAAMGELSAAVAHELRNPLAGIRMAMENLRVEMQDDSLRERVSIMSAELERMTRLLNNLLAQSRMEPEQRSIIDVAAIIREVLQLVRYQTPGNVDLSADLPACMRTEVPPEGLRQAVLNLVLNAVQSLGATPGAVVIGAAQDEDSLRIEVRDSGAGFPEELVNGGVRTFLSGKDGGVGLGLSIVRRFARELGGELRLRNLLEPAGALAELIIPKGKGHAGHPVDH